MACPNVADRAAGYNMPAETDDGNDVLAVHAATRRAIAHARSGKGPYFLECKTFRMTGHSAHDAASYVPKELFDEWEKQDPILRLRQKMLAKGWADQAALDKVQSDVLSEVDEAVAWAEQSPWPDPAGVAEGVYENQ
jgi:pyruvate dehydrogenase E1 component alpha subunit